MPTYTITNPTRAPRTILLTGASHTVLAGESKEIDLPDNIAEDERTAGMTVEKDGKAKSEPETEVEAETDDSDAEAEGDRFDNMTDDELRDFIEDATGERPHPRTGRPKLLAAAREA